MKKLSKTSTQDIKNLVSISQVLRHYGGECTNNSSGAWWCILHEVGGKNNGHKTPSLVAKDNIGTATCLSQKCFEADDIFSVISKMEGLDIKNDFSLIKEKAAAIAGIIVDDDIKNISNETSKIQSVENLNIKHLNYLKETGVSEATALSFALKARGEYILYPQLDDKIIRGYKGISITKDKVKNKSKIFFEGYTAPLFYEFEVKKGRHIIFTEGEKDCLRLSEEILKNRKEKDYIAITVTTGALSVPKDIIIELEKFNPSGISIIYDNDNAGKEGAKKLAEVLLDKFKTVDIYSFSDGNKDGYDVSDFFNEGFTLQDMLNLKKESLQKEEKTLHSLYPQYTISNDSIIDTLTPDKILYSGYKEIDEQCPMILGENTIIVGRTGKGKTVLGVNFVNGILKNNDSSKVLVFSLELKKKSFLQRLLSAEYDIETWKIKKGFVTEDNTVFTTQKENYIKNAYQYINAFENRLMIIDDIHSIEQIEKLLDSLRKELHYIPDYILIDYANILSLRNLVDSNKHIQISTWMKFLAKEKNIHVQAICQANRATKENDDGYARTENLADSDQYGRDAFIVYSIKTSMESDVYSINPTKNRNGKPENEIELFWNGKTGKTNSNKRNIENEI